MLFLVDWMADTMMINKQATVPTCVIYMYMYV